MIRSVRLLLYLEEYEYENNNNERTENVKLFRSIRDKSNPFGISDNKFIKTFRLDKNSVLDLTEQLITQNPELNVQYSSGIPFAIKFLVALNFFGHGSYQKPTADNCLFPMSQSSVSRCIKTVTNELSKLAKNFIKFPKSNEEIASVKRDFMSQLGMAGIIGAMDGCHIAIHQPPAANNGYLYCNRKRFYSLNMLAVCDARLRITYADANFPGSVHDSAIWHTSDLKAYLQRFPNTRSHFILVDSGFPAEPYLLTPIQSTNIKETRYNAAHKSTRNVIERCFGVLKSRFRCLLQHRTLHYSPKTACKIIYCAIILHNVCRERNIPLVLEPDEQHVQYVDINDGV